MTRGEIWWADFGLPFGSEPGFRRPVLIVQDDSFNRSLPISHAVNRGPRGTLLGVMNCTSDSASRQPYVGNSTAEGDNWARGNYGANGGKWHSAKPAAAHTLIESASPGPYLELFARQTAIGWDCLAEDFAA